MSLTKSVHVSKQADTFQITCLYDMDIPRPDNFNETYLYEGKKITGLEYGMD